MPIKRRPVIVQAAQAAPLPIKGSRIVFPSVSKMIFFNSGTGFSAGWLGFTDVHGKRQISGSALFCIFR
jgi:hypothetical protein